MGSRPTELGPCPLCGGWTYVVHENASFATRSCGCIVRLEVDFIDVDSTVVSDEVAVPPVFAVSERLEERFEEWDRRLGGLVVGPPGIPIRSSSSVTPFGDSLR